MSRRSLRNTRRWARYFNHYAYIPGVLVGGNGAFGALASSWRRGPFKHIRRQAKRQFGGAR